MKMRKSVNQDGLKHMTFESKNLEEALKNVLATEKKPKMANLTK